MQEYPLTCQGPAGSREPLGVVGSCQNYGRVSAKANCTAQAVTAYLAAAPAAGQPLSPPGCGGTPWDVMPFTCSNPDSTVPWFGLGFYCQEYNTTKTPLLLWSVYPDSGCNATSATPVHQFLVFLDKCHIPPTFVSSTSLADLKTGLSAMGRRRDLQSISTQTSGARSGQPDLLLNDTVSFVFTVTSSNGQYYLTAYFYEGSLDCAGNPTLTFTEALDTPIERTTKRGYNLCSEITTVGSGNGVGRRQLQSSSGSNNYVVVGDVDAAESASGAAGGLARLGVWAAAVAAVAAAWVGA